MKRALGIGCFLACLALLSTAIIAQDKKMDDKKPAGQQPSKEDMQKMMQEGFTKARALTEQHRQLRSLAGDWQITGRMRMGPDAPWKDSKSSSHAELILGGRFLTQKITGEAMPEFGMPENFEGFGLIGFDNDKKKYTSVWTDNMSTMIMTGEGTASEGARTISFTSHYECPIMHKPTSNRTVYKIEGPDKYVLEMYGPDMETGKEFLGLELTHTRKK